MALRDCPKFDCQEIKLKTFLNAFKNKEAVMGWVPLFTVKVNGLQCHIPDDWGLVTLEEGHAQMVVVHGAQTHTHQDSCMSSQCLWVSLLDDARNKVTSHTNQYTFEGYKSGPALLKAIIACTHIDM